MGNLKQLRTDTGEMPTELSQIDLLRRLVVDMDFVKKGIIDMKEEINDLRDREVEVKPEYLERLDEIEKEGFLSREEFEKEMGS